MVLLAAALSLYKGTCAQAVRKGTARRRLTRAVLSALWKAKIRGRRLSRHARRDTLGLRTSRRVANTRILYSTNTKTTRPLPRARYPRRRPCAFGTRPATTDLTTSLRPSTDDRPATTARNQKQGAEDAEGDRTRRIDGHGCGPRGLLDMPWRPLTP